MQQKTRLTSNGNGRQGQTVTRNIETISRPIPSMKLQDIQDGYQGAPLRYPNDPDYLRRYILGQRRQVCEKSAVLEEMKSIAIHALEQEKRGA